MVVLSVQWKKYNALQKHVNWLILVSIQVYSGHSSGILKRA